IVREGKDVSILSAGSMLSMAMETATILSRSGVEAIVADARFIKPLDLDMIREITDNNRILFTMEENTISGGLGDQVSQALSGLPGTRRLIRLGLSDRFIPHGTREELLEEEGLVPEEIAMKVLQVLQPDRELEGRS
ncbi:MAG: hypothetical protein KOO63_12905, partial [Bacteroidales bacterium]|nr:hypothetical protein [Candidatus Latescibacterota bacterium]